jgi:NADH dehydrogenase
MILVIGATGMLGSEICRLLADQGRPVRALVRATSNPDTIARLTGFGAELVRGDLRDRASLDAACRGVNVVISTASSTVSRQEGDSIDSVDRQGQLNLIEAAAGAGVSHFILISFSAVDIEFPLQTAKRTAEDRLRRSGMAYTILQPTCFAEVWLSPMLGFDVAHARAQIYGSGRNPTSWISFRDVAECAVAALDNPRAMNAVIRLGGPEALSPSEVVSLAEQVTGKTFEVQYVPEEALWAQYRGATDPLQQSFAGLMLYYARGDVIDPKEALAAFPNYRPRSVRAHLEASA